MYKIVARGLLEKYKLSKKKSIVCRLNENAKKKFSTFFFFFLVGSVLKKRPLNTNFLL